MSGELEPGTGSTRPRPDAFDTVAGERSTAAVHRVRSLESRVSNLMALGLMCALGFALLAWYYSAALRRPARAAQSARALTANQAQTEMPLPPLPAVSFQAAPREESPGRVMSVKLEPPPPQPPQALTALPILTGPAHPLPYTLMGIPSYGLSAPAPRASEGAAAPDPRERAFDRRLSGPVFATQSDTSGSLTPPAAVAGPPAVSGAAPSVSDSALASSAASVSGGASRSDSLAELLIPSSTPAALARVLPTRSLLLPKGAFIDCTLETAIDSTLPGMSTCITATDTFGADGTVVLLERGSKLIGETRGEVQQGSARVFVLWTEARTPTGVVIPLASPGTDELGRSGLAGEVDRHFWERFGAAILVSIIDAGAESAVQSGNGTVIYDPTATQDVTTEVLKDTLHIPPTVVKSQGDRIQVLVARDLDFRSVYELRAAAER
ncbi:MAG: type IV secretion system protein VirB10 [Steroidobacteraceae bacterium]